MDRHQVELSTFSGDRTVFLKTLRLVGRISLADAVAVHAHACTAERTVLVAGVDRRVADHIAAAFAAAGIPVVVRPSSVASPMICRPQANEAYRWIAVRLVVAVPASQ